MLILLGKKYLQWIEGIISQLLVVDQIEPNWKSITYKAKMVVCYAWWQQLTNKDQLPFYFSRHMLYIRDVEPYLFHDDSAMKAEPHWTDLTKMNPAHLISFI